LLIIDYLQLISTADKYSNRPNQVAEICRRLMGVIKEHDLYSLIIVQLNREPEKQKRPPIIADMGESGQIEKDAHVIMLLHQDKEENSPVIVNVAKNRNGATAHVPFIFDKKCTRFESI